MDGKLLKCVMKLPINTQPTHTLFRAEVRSTLRAIIDPRFCSATALPSRQMPTMLIKSTGGHGFGVICEPVAALIVAFGDPGKPSEEEA